MVRSFAVRMATLALVAALAVALPLNAGAQETTTGPTQYHYSTSITQVYGAQYPLAGHLDLEIFPNGTLRGYYHNAYQKAFIAVVGGRDGNYIWFDIGPTNDDLGFGIALPPGGRFHVVATTTTDNSFRGQLYPETANVGTPSIGANVPPSAYGGGPDLEQPQNSQFAASSAANLSSPQNGGEQLIFAAKPVEKSSEDYQGAY